MRAGLRAIAILMLLLTASAGCRAGESAPARSSSAPTLRPPSATSSVDRRAMAVQDAVATYRDMWQAYDAAVAVPDPEYPALTRYATGSALHTLVSGLQSLKKRGLKGTGSVTVSPKVTAVSPIAAPTHVAISDCLDDAASHIVRAGPGPAYSDSPGGRHLTLADVQRQSDGSWKVTGFGVRDAGTC